MPEDPRIPTPRETIHNLCNRRYNSDIYVSDRELLRLLTEADAAHRERIATLEEQVRLFGCAMKISADDSNARMNEGNELRADIRRLREALEQIRDDKTASFTVHYMARAALQPASPQSATDPDEPTGCADDTIPGDIVNAIREHLQPAAPPTCKDSLQVQPAAPQLSGNPGEFTEPAPQLSGEAGEMPSPKCTTCGNTGREVLYDEETGR